jgi:PAS domain-containing protein
LAAHRREVEQLQAELGSAARELDTTGKEREALRAEASQVPQLQSRLDGLRNEIDRQFVQHPTPLCRCTREGVITHVNRAFAAMVGCPVVDLQRGVRVASTLFQASDDLTWLVERSLTAGSAGPIELTWKSEDGTRLFVRLSALACADAIEIVAQDITAHRATQDRLAQAQRMEAVGRLASEVAVTCGNLLRDVSQNGQRWLAALDVNTALQHQGEMLLDDVTRAASFLRKLAVYGDEQTSALEPVDLHRVLRDLEPVLKEVAGDDIELVLPKSPPRSSPPFHVDLRAERVERLLVNVASYGRERMPLGGSLIFDLAPTVVDRQFTEKYPNVRQGPHVLLTVTEARGAVRSVGPHGFREELAEAHDAPLAVEKPGVDLSALQGLVRECGGHLWMEAAPPGDMVIKIHLPLRPHDDSARGEPQTAGQARGPLGRWFHH